VDDPRISPTYHAIAPPCARPLVMGAIALARPLDVLVPCAFADATRCWRLIAAMFLGLSEKPRHRAPWPMGGAGITHALIATHFSWSIPFAAAGPRRAASARGLIPILSCAPPSLSAH